MAREIWEDVALMRKNLISALFTKSGGGPMERRALYRICQIDRLLREKRYPNCPKLADRFEVHRRTVERDIEVMRDQLGAPD